ncbi:uncharacterized protein EKO05_0001065 [Ascochyta rabiei]|uniref:uncharacterized protein n=1 Tax=Didymella rabiei TaxID=5454 RepID=UPI002202E02B|nr:uncharacterized protein EKO05_0001065 [Ascochyta rabiei]UPX10403.1 hypothetical protein EKO05_0001065 [Ascochyta rabiei]
MRRSIDSKHQPTQQHNTSLHLQNTQPGRPAQHSTALYTHHPARTEPLSFASKELQRQPHACRPRQSELLGSLPARS